MGTILKATVTEAVLNVSDGRYYPALKNDVVDPSFKHLDSGGTFYPATVVGNTGTYWANNANPPDGNYVFCSAGVVMDGVLGSEASGGTWFGDKTLPYLKNDSSDGHFTAESKRIKLVADSTTGTDALSQARGIALFILQDLTNLPASIALKSGFTMSGNISMAGFKLLGLPAPSSVGEPMRYQDTELLYVRLQNFVDQYINTSTLIFNAAAPYFINEALTLLQGTNLGQVKNLIKEAIEGIISGTVTAAQQSGNIIYVDPSGTQEDHRRYRTLEAAKIEAESYAESDEQYNVTLLGNGVDGAVFTNYNLLPSGSLAQYVNYKGENRNVIMVVGDGVTYTGNANRPIFKSMTIDNENASALTTFTNVIFEDVDFVNLAEAADGYVFNNCHFINCQYDSTLLGGTMSYNSTCTGIMYDKSTKRYINIKTGVSHYLSTGDIQIVTNDGDIQGRRWLGRSDSSLVITMASALVLPSTQGNAFKTTGSTTVDRLESAGWPEGSIITLMIGTNVTINHAGGSSGTSRPFLMKAGANLSALASRAYMFQFMNDNWYEI